jgi:NitT/TauT family transport system substrate-binding protein
MHKKIWAMAGTALLASLVMTPLRAEMSEIKVAQQYGISYLPLMMMEDQKLIEKYAKAAGVEVTV